MKRLYLKISGGIHGIDEYYEPIPKDKTWKSTLEIVERHLDNQYLEFNREVVGVNLKIEITDELPGDVDFDE